LLMATLKKYFNYTLRMAGCGIPRVTLEGEKSDWENILQRLEKLKEFGFETAAWYHLLRPVIRRFIRAFDDPVNPDNVDFWQRVAHYTPGGSGRGDHYSGWITAFMVFNKNGRWIGPQLSKVPDGGCFDEQTVTAETVPDPTLSAAHFWETYGGQYMHKDLILDGTPFHVVHRSSIPPGYGEVDVLIIDDGERFECAMVAGSVGTRVKSSGDRSLSPRGTHDTVEPVLGWWLLVKD
ncbi:hypothetical protein C8R45DRAFT_803333, partial [Mycena sanguinolenta]